MKGFLLSFVYAVRGVWSAISGQRNLKVQLTVALVVIGAGFFFRITSAEWLAMLICIGMVLGLEMMNTAIETLVDLVTLERKPLAGKVKDIAAGAVLIVSFVSVIVGVLIFWKYLMA